MGTLYIVATPLGNREDITIRAIKTLTSVDVIITEDILKASNFISHLVTIYPFIAHAHPTKRTQFIKMNDFSEENSIHEVKALLEKNLTVALVSEAGTPLISDPGYKLVREVLKQHIRVVSIPGPSAPITALVSSGLPTDKFYFLGFLPKSHIHKKKLFGHLIELLNQAEKTKLTPTIIFFESSHRILETLHVMQQVLGDISIVIARELTKIYEEVEREKLSVIIQKYEKQNIKGEFTVLFSLKS